MVCHAPAKNDDELQMVVCTENDDHAASYWGYEWIDFSSTSK